MNARKYLSIKRNDKGRQVNISLCRNGDGVGCKRLSRKEERRKDDGLDNHDVIDVVDGSVPASLPGNAVPGSVSLRIKLILFVVEKMYTLNKGTYQRGAASGHWQVAEINQ
jgi:hypothetical protein